MFEILLFGSLFLSINAPAGAKPCDALQLEERIQEAESRFLSLIESTQVQQAAPMQLPMTREEALETVSKYLGRTDRIMDIPQTNDLMKALHALFFVGCGDDIEFLYEFWDQLYTQRSVFRPLVRIVVSAIMTREWGGSNQ